MVISEDEKYYISFIKKELEKNKNLTFFDVGCNKGFYTQFLLEIFDDSSSYYLFEASERFFKISLDKFKTIENIKIFNIGVSDTNDVSDFYELVDPNDEVEGMSSFNKRNVFSNYSIESKKINTIKLDDFITKNKIEKIDFIKIDTEGNELKILHGLSDSLKNDVINFIQIEYGDCSIENGYDLSDILKFLNNFNYTLWYYVNNNLIKINDNNYINYNKLSWSNFLIIKNGIK